MPTIEQFLKNRLPEDIAKAAIQNIAQASIRNLETHSIGTYKDAETNEANALEVAFVWALTKEGSEYWIAVNDKYFKVIETKIPTPNHLKQIK